jgi:hypothetical protein
MQVASHDSNRYLLCGAGCLDRDLMYPIVQTLISSGNTVVDPGLTTAFLSGKTTFAQLLYARDLMSCSRL